MRAGFALTVAGTINMTWVWDKWQQKVLDTDGNLALRCGRQTGKSEVISAKVAKLAQEHSGINILLIALTI